ncbi:hypothetical protein JCM10212_000938 [Sporobolomyces blumeae]
MAAERLLEALVVLVPAAHALLAPYTKVEESFTLHATRDMLLRGISTDAVSKFDHIEFPGAVPRSFVGPGMLAAISYPVVRAAHELGVLEDGVQVQVLIRLVLALVSSLSLIYLGRRVRIAFGSSVATYFYALSMSQFHIPFWMSRTVPNMIAFPLVQVSLGLLISPSTPLSTKSARQQPLVAFAILTFCAVVLRLELAALLVPLALEQLFRGSVTLFPLVATGAITAAASLGLTSIVDGHLWRIGRSGLYWPEGASFLFNVVEGKSSEWGTSPAYTYFLLTLPKLLLLALPLSPVALFLDRRCRRIGIPSLVFIAILSGLEHKEWRFIAYSVPALNVCAATGIRAVGALFGSRRLRRLVTVTVVTTNIAFTLVGLLASRDNYPGAQAVARIDDLIARSGRSGVVNIHVSPHVAMTGASNFVLHDRARSASGEPAWYLSPLRQEPASLLAFSKTESDHLDSPEAFADSVESFDYLLVDANEPGYPAKWRDSGEWSVVEEVGEFAGFGKVWKGETFGLKQRRSVAIVGRT